MRQDFPVITAPIKAMLKEDLAGKGGCDMSEEGLWELFMRTGLPECYALYRNLGAVRPPAPEEGYAHCDQRDRPQGDQLQGRG